MLSFSTDTSTLADAPTWACPSISQLLLTSALCVPNFSWYSSLTLLRPTSTSASPLGRSSYLPYVRSRCHAKTPGSNIGHYSCDLRHSQLPVSGWSPSHIRSLLTPRPHTAIWAICSVHAGSHRNICLQSHHFVNNFALLISHWWVLATPIALIFKSSLRPERSCAFFSDPPAATDCDGFVFWCVEKCSSGNRGTS